MTLTTDSRPPDAGDDALAVAQFLCEERSRRLDRLMAFNGQAVLGAAARAAAPIFAHDHFADLTTRKGILALALFILGLLSFGAAVVWNWKHNIDHCRKLDDCIQSQTPLDPARPLLAEQAFPQLFGPCVFIAVLLLAVAVTVSMCFI